MNTPFEYELFISFAEPDRAWVEGYLIPALGLSRERIITYDNFRLGAARVDEIERAVKNSRYIIVILGPTYLTDEWSKLGEQLASYLTTTEAQIRLIPLLKVECELPLRVDFRVRLDYTASGNWERETKRLRDLLNLSEPQSEPIVCPYPGMIPFRVQDARWFYGRTKEIDELAGRIHVQNFLFVIGPSGTGKSSLVFAGLVAELNKRQPNIWFVKSIRPGSEPLTALNDSTARLSDFSAGRSLLIIDQFEELFTQSNKPTQAAFIAHLKSLRAENICAIVITMRSDFYTDLMNSDLWPVDLSERYEIAPLRGTALTDAIAKPAEQVGVYVEAGLIERLLADASDEPGVLPLLQETMTLLWDKRERRFLPLRVYEDLGNGNLSGLAVAIATRADAVFAQLAESQRKIARRIFLRLVQFGEGRPDTRRQQRVSALRAAGDDVQEFDRTLKHLIDNRLLTSSGEESKGERKIDIAHEALIPSWFQLYEWIKDYQEVELTRRRLQVRAEGWIQLDRRGGFLDESELTIAREWLATAIVQDLGIDSDVRDFIAASQAKTIVTKRAQWQRPLVAAALMLLVILAGWFGYQEWLRQRAIQLSPQVNINSGTTMIGVTDKDHTDHKEYTTIDLNMVTPAWEVTLATFKMDKHEVTNEQYCLCRRTGACPGGPENVCQDNPLKPVTRLTLNQASDFCAWIGRRLPTEFEWEWVARGKERRIYPTGNTTPDPNLIHVNPGDGSLTEPVPVSETSQDRTPDGVLDMSGNVREWTVSPYLRYDDPQYRMIFWPTPTATSFYVARGGGFLSGVTSAIASFRFNIQSDATASTVGLRCLEGVPLADYSRR